VIRDTPVRTLARLLSTYPDTDLGRRDIHGVVGQARRGPLDCIRGKLFSDATKGYARDTHTYDGCVYPWTGETNPAWWDVHSAWLVLRGS
jgi:hypothetical protein